jgi:hypothetical protein
MYVTVAILKSDPEIDNEDEEGSGRKESAKEQNEGKYIVEKQIEEKDPLEKKSWRGQIGIE